MGDAVLTEPQERDADVAAEILGLLLERYESADEINAQCAGDLMTALHVAVQRTNLVAVRLLLEMEEIRVGVENGAGQRAVDLGREVLVALGGKVQRTREREREVKDAKEILKMLEERTVG